MALIAQQLGKQFSWDWHTTNRSGEQKPKKRLHNSDGPNGSVDVGIEDMPTTSPLTPAPSASTEEPLVITMIDGEQTTKKTTKASSMKDPESGLTMDTVKRRKLCVRFDKMVSEVGMWHRIHELPKLTNIQVGGLLRRSRNRSEMTDVSETVWDHVYEEKRRSDDRVDCDGVLGRELVRKERLMREDDDGSEPTDVSDQEDDAELSDIFFDGMCGFGVTTGDLKSFQSTSNYYESRRCILETDRWLMLLSRSLHERRSKLQQFAKETIPSPDLFLGTSNDDSCARCIPIDKNYRRKIVRFTPCNISTSSRYRDFEQIGSDVRSPEDELESYFEQLSVKLEEEDPSIRAKIYAQQKEGILMVKSLNEQRRKTAQARLKERAKRWARVGRPLKHTNGFRQKKLKKLRMDALNALAQSTNLENVIERKTLEEQLHRLSSGYKYEEIPIPQFRSFDLDVHEQSVDHSSRKSSNDSLNDEPDELPSLTRGETNEAFFFGKIHHNVEFPQYSEEEKRRRRRQNLYPPATRHIPYDRMMYAHEDPQNNVLESWVSVSNS